MSPYAFTEESGYEVDKNIYDRHGAHDYETSGDLEALPGPVVLLGMQNVTTYQSCGILMLVDTGASISTLSAYSADRLGISRRLRPGDTPILLSGLTESAVVGLRRRVCVALAETYEEMDVAVAPDPMAIRAIEQELEEPLSPIERDLLSAVRLVRKYLLCFDAERLYAFPRLQDAADGAVGT